MFDTNLVFNAVSHLLWKSLHYPVERVEGVKSEKEEKIGIVLLFSHSCMSSITPWCLFFGGIKLSLSSPCIVFRNSQLHLSVQIAYALQWHLHLHSLPPSYILKLWLVGQLQFYKLEIPVENFDQESWSPRGVEIWNLTNLATMLPIAGLTTLPYDY